MARALRAFINVGALQQNLAKIRARVPHQKIMAMVKADGYGHGLVNVAVALKDADAFGVACLEEAVVLRAAGVKNRIVLMSGFYDGSELPLILELNLELAIHHERQVHDLKMFKTGVETAIPIWIKINTGMNRLGFRCEQVRTVFETLSQCPLVKHQGFITHFASSEEVDNAETAAQIIRFFQTVETLPGEKSLANSAAILGIPASYADWVRPGILLFGVSPYSGRVGRDEDLTAVMTLQSELIAIQSLKAGEAVGYGGEYVCKKDTRIGVVAGGYGDGYPRLMPSGTPVLVNGRPVPLVGRVSMDMLTVDLGNQPEAKIGDPVQLWGPDLPVERVAAAVGTSPYELLTRLAKRVPFEMC
ncbi:MAG TPA: alanine racemase [Gammaproteobacteria bacterium]|nr:alanine racemase [Gammaproteobacteria bacterium]